MNRKYAIIFKGEMRTNVFLFDVVIVNGDVSYSAPVGNVIVNTNTEKGYSTLPNEMIECKSEIIKECCEMAKDIKEIIEPQI